MGEDREWREARAEEEAYRSGVRTRRPPVFVPRPDPAVRAGVEVTDPGSRALARLGHLEGWGGPDALRAMGWHGQAAELERLRAWRAARGNAAPAVAGRGAEEVAETAIGRAPFRPPSPVHARSRQRILARRAARLAARGRSRRHARGVPT
jgi:hypothetical protein